MPRGPTVFIDQDCTIADFIAGLAVAHGVFTADLYARQPKGVYDYTTALGECLGRWDGACRKCCGFGRATADGRVFVEDNTVTCDLCNGSCKNPDPFTAADFWRPLDRLGAEFWADLPEFPWTSDLIAAVESVTDDWYVLTSPSRCPGCFPGKQQWLCRVLGVEYTRKLIPTEYKHLLARPGAVLIDDHEANCEAFVTCPRTGEPTGARAVLFPAHHNRLHALAADPLPHVKTQVELHALNAVVRKIRSQR